MRCVSVFIVAAHLRYSEAAAADSTGATASYFQITSGRCSDEGGIEIVDKTDCKAAAAAVGFVPTETNIYKCDARNTHVCGDARPRGCFREDVKLQIFPDSTGGCFFWGSAKTATACFCKKRREPTESETAEYKQDFIDFDTNKDDQIDAQEVRSQFKGNLDPKELHQFFIDADKDGSGTVTLLEYIDYAVTLAA
eukprot:gnl/TRDRNA2_/TRDRNA2_171874_c0_seq3.p1 gnl/TRDRNA2_/TRDRNA2_171874_c0~~gnl/TRDRNA2_/TRDRNA2_171874_c0_seq3.p1  ORF type:complete len:195 (+),score=32.87 gnl/TRDRNA2_/TRDRNA2_171874_c0_seq3:63-647(+)